MTSHSKEDIWELFTERAAIREHDGESSREHADNRALIDVKKIIGTLPHWLVLAAEEKRNGGIHDDGADT
jgi:hypothetical protein